MPIAAPSLFILAAARTPLGAFGGVLKRLPMPVLAAEAMKGVLSNAKGADPDQIFLGCALGAGNGPEPAQRAASLAGLKAPALTVNAGSASGLSAVILGLRLAAEAPGLVLAGGAEAPSQAPYLAPEARWGRRVGAMELRDALLVDGPELQTPSQGTWTAQSQQRAAHSSELRQREITPLLLETRRGPQRVFEDQAPGASAVAFPAGRAPLADGAAMVLAGPGDRIQTRPLARVLGWMEGDGNLEKSMGTLFQELKLEAQAITRWEVHEGSESQMEAFFYAFPQIDPSAVNPHGGALALGDPWGASGARLVGSLVQDLRGIGVALVHSPTRTTALVLRGNES